MDSKVSVQIILSSTVAEKHEIFRIQLQSLESELVNFVTKTWKSDVDVYQCGLYSLNGRQHEKFQILEKLYIHPIKAMIMRDDETYETFLDRRVRALIKSADQFTRTRETMELL